MAEQKTVTKTINVLEGSLDVIPDTGIMGRKLMQTLQLNGLGKYLTGKYYIEEITRTHDSNGFTISLTVSRSDFRSTIK